jgi:Xaa-Pro dipeptidase
MMASMNVADRSHARVIRIQQAIREQPGLDGWLFYDFRHLDPIAYRVLLLDPSLHVTRRWYYWVPAQGTPVKLQHRIEPHVLDGLPGDCVRTSLGAISTRLSVPCCTLPSGSRCNIRR